MSDESKLSRISQLTPITSGVGVGMNIDRGGVSSNRIYMLGKNMGKAAAIREPTSRKIVCGDEGEYANTARKIELHCDAVVDEIFYVKDPLNKSEPTVWGSYYVVFCSVEDGTYFLLEMEKFHTQNADLGFEYHYNKELMRKLERGALFPAGTVFAQSSRINSQNQWCPGIEARVAPMSDHDGEEDAIKIAESFAKRVGVTFERKYDRQWNEDEWVLLNLYGEPNIHQGFPLVGERVREDGILFGLRRKDSRDALVTLTKEALMRPNDTYDKLYYAEPGSVVADVRVETDRYKNQANNKKAYKRTHPHTRHLESYESEYNAFHNSVVGWYTKKKLEMPNGELVPLHPNLWNFITHSMAKVTVDYVNYSNQRYNNVKCKFQNIQLKDWRLIIRVKQEVDAKVRFKMTGMHGNKTTIGKIVPDERMPVDDYGERADIVTSNIQDFKRQIFTSLVELDVNFVNIRLYPEFKKAVLEGAYAKAWDIVSEFFGTVSPHFAELIEELDADQRIEYMQLMASDENEFSYYPDPNLGGIDVIKRLDDKYGHIKPTPVTFINEFGDTIRTITNIPITSAYMVMLDKFGDDISSQSTGKVNIFGLPTSLSKEERVRNFYRAQLNRNIGAAEGRLFLNQQGGALAVQQLVLGHSPDANEMAVKRILRAENPFMVERLVYPGEENKNYSLGLIRSILADYGLCLRKQNDEDIKA